MPSRNKQIQSIAMPPDLREWAKETALRDGSSLSAYVCQLIEQDKERRELQTDPA
jgi:hypothetical protein